MGAHEITLFSHAALFCPADFQVWKKLSMHCSRPMRRTFIGNGFHSHPFLFLYGHHWKRCFYLRYSHIYYQYTDCIPAFLPIHTFMQVKAMYILTVLSRLYSLHWLYPIYVSSARPFYFHGPNPFAGDLTLITS